MSPTMVTSLDLLSPKDMGKTFRDVQIVLNLKNFNL